jgi:hypothetical protein
VPSTDDIGVAAGLVHSVECDDREAAIKTCLPACSRSGRWRFVGAGIGEFIADIIGIGAAERMVLAMKAGDRQTPRGGSRGGPIRERLPLTEDRGRGR